MNFVKTEPGADPIVVEGRFSASPSQVFRAWTDPVEVKRWFGAGPGSLCDAVIDLRPGGAWRFTEEANDQGSVGFEGHYIEVEKDRLLVFSWSKFTERPGRQSAVVDRSRVEINLELHGAVTHMRITHSALADHDERIGFRFGWERGTTNLAELLETTTAS